MITENVMACEKNTFQVKFDSAGNTVIFHCSPDICPFKSLFCWTFYKSVTQDFLARCSVIVSDHNVELTSYVKNLFGQCLVTSCYF